MHFPRGADYLLHLTQSLHSFWGFSRSICLALYGKWSLSNERCFALKGKACPCQVHGDALVSLPKHAA